jgi:DNA-directed RNA polymerase specialized sigma24 family protein
MELRAGRATFEQVAAAAAPILGARSARALRMWSSAGQTQYLEEADLVQEMNVRLWRALDEWDPARCSDVVRYVDAATGRAAREVLRKAAGYPDPRRDKKPARQARVEDIEAVVNVLNSHEPEPEILIDARRAVDATLSELRGFDRRVVELVVEGWSIEEAGRAIYADPDLRVEYRLDCVKDAERAARSASRRVAASMAGAAFEG